MSDKISLLLVSTIVISAVLFSAFTIQPAKANLIVAPARLGILRLQIYPFSPAFTVREFMVGNTYNTTMSIHLEPTGDMVSLITISEPNFTLSPMENRTVEFTLTSSKVGYYTGAIMVKADIEGRGSVGYNDEISVFVNEANIKNYIYGGIAAAAVLCIAVFYIIFQRGSSSKGKLSGAKRS
jgi:hypothetical protein